MVVQDHRCFFIYTVTILLRSYNLFYLQNLDPNIWIKMNDIEIIYETKNGKSSDHPIANRNETIEMKWNIDYKCIIEN